MERFLTIVAVTALAGSAFASGWVQAIFNETHTDKEYTIELFPNNTQQPLPFIGDDGNDVDRDQKVIGIHHDWHDWNAKLASLITDGSVSAEWDWPNLYIPVGKTFHCWVEYDYEYMIQGFTHEMAGISVYRERLWHYNPRDDYDFID
jgi:hypothetical protein